MARLSFDRLTDEIGTQTGLLAEAIGDADLATPVHSCPGWTVRDVARHVGGGHRWVAQILRTRSTEPVDDGGLRDLAAYPDEDPATVAAWLRDGAEQLTDALREAGPDVDVWTPVPGRRSAFFARRFAHEDLVHRADAELALGRPFGAAPDLVVDAIDEWMELGSLPMMFDFKPDLREVLGPGRTIHLHATDTPDAEWVVDLTGDVITWRPSHEKSAVAWRGPVTELLLGVYRRRPPRGDGLEVIGDGDLLDLWLSKVGFG